MKTCPYCQKEVKENAVKCSHCGGWFENDAEMIQKKLDQSEQVERLLKDKKDKSLDSIGETTLYFSIPTPKLATLCIISLGLYDIYWFYKNWKAVKEQESKKISPFWRAVFYVLFCFSLFKRIMISASQKGYKSRASYVQLTILYIILVLLPDSIGLLSILSFIPIIYICNAVRFNNAHIDPNYIEQTKITKTDIIFGLFGLLLWAALIYGFLYPEA